MNELAPRQPDPDAYPISNTVLQHESLMMAANQFFGRSLTKGLDQWGLPADTVPGLLAVLQEFKRPGSNPHHALREGPLEFCYQAFLVLCPREVVFTIAATQGVNFLMPPEFQTKNIAVLGGTLRAWKQVITQILHPRSSRAERLLLNRIIWHFERQDLGGMFRDFAKRDAKDGTFYLEPK